MNDLNMLKIDFAPWTYPSNWVNNIKDIFRHIKWSWQRITKGYSERDLFDLDYYYANLFSGTLKDFAKGLHSYPGPEISYDEWRDALCDTADKFEKCHNYDFFTTTTNNYEEIYEQCKKYKDEGFDFLKKWFFHLWD